MTRTPFDDFRTRLRALTGYYARCMAVALGFLLIFGLWPPVAVAALLFTICLPVIALILWGRSLDEELGWTDREQGPW